MNDSEALAEINRILDLWFRAEIGPFDTLARIAHVTGLHGGAK